VGLLILAEKFERLVRTGSVRNFAEIAELASVSRARISQVMGLRRLPADIQQELRGLPQSADGRDLVMEQELRPLLRAREPSRQRELWKELLRRKLAMLGDESTSQAGADARQSSSAGDAS